MTTQLWKHSTGCAVMDGEPCSCGPFTADEIAGTSNATSRKLTREIVATRPVATYSHCSYCGLPCRGPACPSHRDLLALEPHRLLGGSRTSKEETDVSTTST